CANFLTRLFERSEKMKGIDYLRDKLNVYRRGALYRQTVYDMKNIDISPGITIPPQLRQQYQASLGWGAKAVDSLADRLVFREFANDNFNINEIFQMNSADILFDDAKLSALVNSCSFIYISEGDEDLPRLQAIQGPEATGIIDPVSSDTPAPLLVPIIHRPDSSKPFGRSRITPSAIYYQKYAKRTLERADVTAEFYSWPQKYAVGTSQDSEPMDSWKATVASMLEFTKDEDGDKPTLGQFNVPSMSPFTEQLRTAASGFAGETGLTLDDLGFPSDNPSSAEAIKASHETLRLQAEKAQRDFSSGFLNVGYL